METTAIQLASLHVLHFLTYSRSDKHRERVEDWLGGLGDRDVEKGCVRFSAPREGTGLARVDLTREDDRLDVLMVLFQEAWDPAASLDDCATRIQEARDFQVVSRVTRVGTPHPPPERPQPLGQTMVLMGEDEGDHDETARTLAARLRTGKRPLPRGGAIADGISLYTDDACDLVLVLARPEEEVEASRRVYTLLRHYLTFVHKVRAQQVEYDRHRERIKALPSGLREQIERLNTRVLDLAGAERSDRPQLLSEALTERIQLFKEDQPFREALGLAEAMRATLIANRHNLSDLLKDMGRGPGVEALGRQIDRVGRGIATIDADLAYARPHVEEIDRVLRDHHESVLTAQSLAEAHANDLREREEADRDRRNFRLALLAFWLGLIQIWAAAVSLAYGAENWPAFLSRLVYSGLWMLMPAILLGILVWFWIKFDPSGKTH